MEIPVDFFESLYSLINVWTVVGVFIILSIFCFACYKVVSTILDSDLRERKKFKTEIKSEIKNDFSNWEYCPFKAKLKRNCWYEGNDGRKKN